jgi:hypothetical protein
VRFVTVHRGLFAEGGRSGFLAAARTGLRRAGFEQIARGDEVELWRLRGKPRKAERPRTAACRAWAADAL